MQVSSRYNNAQCQVHAYFQSYRQAFHDLGYNGMACLIGSQVNTFHDVHCLYAYTHLDKMIDFDASCIKHRWQILTWLILLKFGNVKRPNHKCGKEINRCHCYHGFTHTLCNRLVHNVGDPLCWVRRT